MSSEGLLHSLPVSRSSISAMVFGGFPGNQPPPPQFVGWLFIIFGGGFLYCWGNSRHLYHHRGTISGPPQTLVVCFRWVCCECFFMPFGAILGVFTIILLSRESIKSMFD